MVADFPLTVVKRYQIKRHVTGCCDEIPVIMTTAITLLRFVSLVFDRLCQILSILFQQLVESLFDASFDYFFDLLVSKKLTCY